MDMEVHIKELICSSILGLNYKNSKKKRSFRLRSYGNSSKVSCSLRKKKKEKKRKKERKKVFFVKFLWRLMFCWPVGCLAQIRRIVFASNSPIINRSSTVYFATFVTVSHNGRKGWENPLTSHSGNYHP